MKTPDEARKCVCPHRVTAATKLYIERGINPWEYMECQADKCMMWRWGRKFLFFKSGKGYCGLAGKP